MAGCIALSPHHSIRITSHRVPFGRPAAHTLGQLIDWTGTPLPSALPLHSVGCHKALAAPQQLGGQQGIMRLYRIAATLAVVNEDHRA
jgi:hypothetical protein